MAIVYILVGAVLIGVHVFIASVASDLAQDKGYEKQMWFHMCFWLGGVSYLLLCAMPNKRLTEAMESLAKQEMDMNKKLENLKTPAAPEATKTTTFDDLPNL